MRLPIDRAFSMKGFGTVVTGTLISERSQKVTSWSCCRRESTCECAGCRCTTSLCMKHMRDNERR